MTKYLRQLPEISLQRHLISREDRCTTAAALSHFWFFLVDQKVLPSFSKKAEVQKSRESSAIKACQWTAIVLNHSLTLFNNCCPTRYPKKSVKLTGCPLTDLEMIFFKYFEDHGGDKCFCQYFSTAVFNSGIILCAICLSSGKLGWLYKVERYLKIIFQ